ncbi:MAG: ABC transporter substrate-binding protein [Oscillospiraceae bacterium]|nr:ABC transporter substrate-binding protein [Oscillospiraceae bacterium]
MCRHLIPKAAALCCCTALLASCGRAETSAAVRPDGNLDECTLRFSWWGGDDRHEATLEAIELWNELHPEIRIIPEYGGWDGWTEKINSQISGGNAPDVMQVNYDWLVTLSRDGTGFYDLGDLGNYLDLSGFDSETLSFGMINDRLNAVTVSMSGRGLFYNSQVYDRVGAEYPATWQELLSLGNTFSNYGCYPIDLDIQSGGTAWYLAVVYVQQQTGKTFITMDGELGFDISDIKMALDFYKSLEDNHVIRTVRQRSDEDGSSALYQSAEFIGGNVGGVFEWGSAIGKYEAVLDENVLECGPYLTDGNGNSSGWMIKPSLMYAISSSCAYPDEAAAFMNFLLNDSGCAEILGTSRGIPASSYARDELEKSGHIDGLSKQSTDMLLELDTITVSPYMELSRMKDFYNTAIEQISYGNTDTETAASEMYESIKNYLEKLKS